MKKNKHKTKKHVGFYKIKSVNISQCIFADGLAIIDKDKNIKQNIDICKEKLE